MSDVNLFGGPEVDRFFTLLAICLLLMSFPIVVWFIGLFTSAIPAGLRKAATWLGIAGTAGFIGLAAFVVASIH